jgi:hypothetical protein
MRIWTSFALGAVLALGGCDCEDPDDDTTAGDDDTTAGADDDSTAGDDDDATAGDDDDSTASDDDDSADPDPYVQPTVYVTPIAPQPGDTVTIHYRGEHAAEAELSIRYGFNGYNQVESIDEYIEWYHVGNWDYYLEAAMAPVLDGFDFELEVPADARALQFTFFFDDVGETVWDENGGWGYNQSLVFPYIGPVLTWNDATSPDDGVVITFETSVPCLGRVEYGPTDTLGTTVIGDERLRMHHFALTGLEPDTPYHYRVLDSAGHVSEIFTFSTAPATTEELSFAVLADMQDNGDGARRWEEVATEVLQGHPEIAFWLAAGDLPTDNVPGDWWTFFDKGRDLFASKVIVPAVGNHDTPTDQPDPDCEIFSTYFDLPTSDSRDGVYRVDVGPVTVLTLNSEVISEFEVGLDQYVWTESQLGQLTPDTAWVFAQWHVPPYNVGDRFEILHQEAVRETTALFDGAVDWVFTGHEHLYQRTLPLRHDVGVAPSGDYGAGEDDGVGYMVMPTAGIEPRFGIRAPDSPVAYLRDLMAYPHMGAEAEEADSEIGFVVVTISGDTIALETTCMGSGEVHLPPYVCDGVSYVK